MRKTAFCICENKDEDQLRSNCAFVFATRIVQHLFFLNPKFQASGHLLWLYSTVCVGNPEDRFSHNGAHMSQVMSSEFPTRSDTNWAVKPQKLARGLKFHI